MFNNLKEKQKKALLYERVNDQNDFYCIHFFLWRDYIAVMYLFADVLNIQNDCSCLILQRKNRKKALFYERVYDQNDFYCIHFFLWRDYVAVMYLFVSVLLQFLNLTYKMIVRV